MVEQDLINLINSIKTSEMEDNYLELKSAKGAPNIYSMLFSFSNQNGGGRIIVGINEKDDLKNME